MGEYSVQIKDIDDKKGRLAVSGLLTVENSEKIKSDLSQLVLSKYAFLEIFVQDVVEVDLSFLQLMKAFEIYLKKQPVDFSISWSFDDEQVALLSNSGFTNFV